MKLYLGLDSGSISGWALLSHEDEYCELIDCGDYSSNGSIKNRLPVDKILSHIKQEPYLISMESLEWRAHRPESIMVIKGVARMQGTDIGLLSASSPDNARYVTLKSGDLCDILNIPSNADKRTRYNAVIPLIDNLTDVHDGDGHIKDAIVFAYCGRFKKK